MLGKIADFYEEEVDTAVAGLLTLLEPIMIAILGIVVAASSSRCTCRSSIYQQADLVMAHGIGRCDDEEARWASAAPSSA